MKETQQMGIFQQPDNLGNLESTDWFMMQSDKPPFFEKEDGVFVLGRMENTDQ